MMKALLTFEMGPNVLSVECDDDERTHPDSVAFNLRERTGKGRPGRRVTAEFGVRRARVLKLAVQLLELADRMTPETIGNSYLGGLPVIGPCDADEQHAFARLGLDDPLGRGRSALDRYNTLRRRLPILHQAQRVIEACDEATAATLQMLLVCTQHTGQLPVQLSVEAVSRGGDR